MSSRAEERRRARRKQEEQVGGGGGGGVFSPLAKHTLTLIKMKIKKMKLKN